jgi:hypothetical protein
VLAEEFILIEHLCQDTQEPLLACQSQQSALPSSTS